MKSIGIFPASGALGTSTYTHLLARVPADRVILISRYPEKTPQEHVSAGARTRQASYESSAADLEAAFAGVDVLLLISYPSHQHELRTGLQLPVVNAAHRAGVQHVVYASLAFALPHHAESRAEVMRAHLDTEEQLRMLGGVDRGFTWTSVREGLYSESFPIYTAFFDIAAPEEEVCVPHDGDGPGVSWAKRDELGEATAALLARCARDPAAFEYRNHLIALTGPRTWTLAETVGVLAEAAGRPVAIRRVSVDEYVKLPKVAAYFGSEELARTWATAWEAIRSGEADFVAPTLGELLGREPEAFDVTIRNMAIGS